MTDIQEKDKHTQRFCTHNLSLSVMGKCGEIDRKGV